jgi:hypothetical protein
MSASVKNVGSRFQDVSVGRQVRIRAGIVCEINGTATAAHNLVWIEDVGRLFEGKRFETPGDPMGGERPQ